MAYIHTSSLIYPISEAEIREACPNVSFPVPFVAPEEFANVFPAPQPSYDSATQRVREIAPELTANGWYEQRWQVLALSAEQIEELRKARVPPAVSMRQARLALLSVGMLDAISAAIGNMPSPQKEAAQIEWEYSNEVQRHNGFVDQLGPALGLTSAQLDALFIAASKL